MHHLPGVAFVKDLDGKYVYYNEAAWIQFRMRPEDIVGKTDEQIWSSDHAGRYRENDLAVIEGKRPIEFVETVAHSDGIHSWLIYKFPIIEHGKVVLVGGVGIDITERRILEDQLTQARKMEALGRLAGGVAHDFNNLLTVISGYGQLALEGAGLAPTEKMILWLQEILNSSRRASSLTSQLLAFSRRQAVQPKLLDLGELLRNMLRLLQRVIGEHVDLSVHTGSTPCLIHADVHQIEQVVMNLAVNALDAMPLGGYLEIRCEELAEPAVLPNPDGEMTEPLGILLEVRDTGIGMDETVRPQIFDPFFYVEREGERNRARSVDGLRHRDAGEGENRCAKRSRRRHCFPNLFSGGFGRLRHSASEQASHRTAGRGDDSSCGRRRIRSETGQDDAGQAGI